MNRLRIIALVAGFLCPWLAQAEVHSGTYGVAKTFPFKLYAADGTLDVDEVDAGTEVSLSCDEGAETTATNDFVDEGTSYSIAVTAAEMRCSHLAVVIAATTTEVFFIENTYPGVHTQGLAQSGTGTTVVLAAATSFADDILNGATIEITGGTGAGQSRVVSDWVSTTDTATVDTWTTNPDSTSTYRVWATAPGTLTAAAIVNEWETQSQADPTGFHVNVLEIGGTVQTANDNGADINAILVDTGTTLDGRIPAALVGGRMDSSTGAMAADVVTAAAVAPAAIDAATFAADVDAEVLSYVVDDATRIDASELNADIDSLAFGVAGQANVNVESINTVAITGDGSGTPFAVAFRREQEDFLRSCMPDLSKREARKATRMAQRYGFTFQKCNDFEMIQAGGFR